MTMTDITIPKEALGAAAHHAAITIYRLVDPDTRAHELTEDELGEVAIAAIAAAINAWPGFEYRADVAFPAFGYGPAAIILPLTQENNNAET